MQRVTEQQSVNSLHSHAKKSRLPFCHELLKLHTVATKKNFYHGKKIQSTSGFSSAEQ